MTSSRSRWILGSVLFFALALRVPGLLWGIPDAQHTWPYHPDESLALTALAKMNPWEGNFNPGIPAGGHAFVYMTAMELGAAHLLGIVHLTPDHDYYRANPGALKRIYLLMRAAGVGWDLLGVFAVALIATRLGGAAAGGWAGALAAANPGRVYLSHFSTYYVPGLALTALSCYFFLRAERSRRDLLIASILAGLAAGMVYIAAISLLLGAMRLLQERDARGFLLMLGGALAAFAFSSPYFFLDLSLTLSGFQRIRHFYLADSGFTASSLPRAWMAVLPAALGWPVLALGIAGLPGMMRRSERKAAGIFAFYGVIALVLFAWTRSPFARHYSPVFPVVEVTAGLCAARLTSRVGKVFAALVLLAGIAHSMAHNTSFLGLDPRDSSRNWVEENIPSGARFAGINWYFAPHLDLKRHPTVMLWKAFPEALDETPHEYLILSDWEVDLEEWSRDRRYDRVATFEDRIPGWARRFLGPNDPPDLRYSRPVIAVFQRVSGQT